jgi:hypothetical protein
VTGWTLHDLRCTFATRLAEMKVAPHIVERLLNHKLGSIGNKTDGMVSAVAEVYNRAAYSIETREAVGLWESISRGFSRRNRQRVILLFECNIIRSIKQHTGQRALGLNVAASLAKERNNREIR